MHPNRKDAITHEQARKSLQRFVNLHFKNVGEKSRASIPAHQDDDDILLSDYISQQEFPRPGLGSGALREALKVGDEVLLRARVVRQYESTVEVGINRISRHVHSYYCVVDYSDLLSLSSPIEPAAGKGPTEMLIRMFLWQGHGHEGIYGDDGEMQCGECHVDYKRDSLDICVEKARVAALQAGLAKLARPPQASSEICEAHDKWDDEAIQVLAKYSDSWSASQRRAVAEVLRALAPSRQGAAKRVEG